MESADGVIRLYNTGRFNAKCYDAVHTTINATYVDGDEAFCISWCRWQIPRMVWSHGAALLFLHGATLATLVQPTLLLAGHLRPIMDPEPGMNDVVLAEIYETSSELTAQQLFQLLVSDAKT